MDRSLIFITNTAPVAANNNAAPSLSLDERFSVVGYDAADECVYLLSTSADGRVPRLCSMRVSGQRAGRVIELDDPELGAADEQRFFETLRKFSGELRPLDREPRGLYRLQTRVIRRVALSVDPKDPPIRKYTLRLEVAPAGGGRATRAYVSAYLRPRADLVAIYRIPNRDQVVATVSYTGIPREAGYEKQAALLVGQV